VLFKINVWLSLRSLLSRSSERSDRSGEVFSSFSTFLGGFTATVIPAKQGSGFETSCMTVSPGWEEREGPVAGTWSLFLACAGGGSRRSDGMAQMGLEDVHLFS